ncbi:DUF7691 family protein (plasmid) [Streptomyces sp. BI20]|uniref:DUF7691 family protein n=1 Tax=Streptomyces sp. BI20 TaxID=3403460 RepID=UPI003C73FEFA
MSKVVNYSMANPGRVLRFLPVVEPTEDETRLMGLMREAAADRQDDLDRQGVDWGLSVPKALEGLFAGRAESDAEHAGCAYHTALQIVIDHNASDPDTLGSYRSPSTFFGVLDKALAELGVPADLLPYQYVYSGWADEVPFPVPYPTDGSPEIGSWPLAKAVPAIEAYRAVHDAIDADLRYDLGLLTEALDGWASEWKDGEGAWWWAPDGAIFFSITG